MHQNCLPALFHLMRFLVPVLLAAGACETNTRDTASEDAGLVEDVVSTSPADESDRPQVDTAAPLACFEPTIEGNVETIIRTEQECAIWNSLSSLQGTVTLKRNGNALSIDFGDGVVFVGMVDGVEVTLAYVHQHDFTDNCGWQATETLTGQLDSDTCLLSVTYQYLEEVVIDRGGCATPCSADADIQLNITPLI